MVELIVVFILKYVAMQEVQLVVDPLQVAHGDAHKIHPPAPFGIAFERQEVQFAVVGIPSILYEHAAHPVTSPGLH